MSPASILIVKPSSLGDIVHTLPAVHRLKETYPRSRLAWIVNSEWKPLLESNPDLAEIIEFPRRSFRGVRGAIRFFAWCQKLQRLRPDLVCDFQGLFRSAWMARSSQARQIAGLSDAREGARFLYHCTARVNLALHAVERYLALADLCGATSKSVEFFLPEGEPIEGIDRPYILLHPYARGFHKSLTPREIDTFIRAFAPCRVVVAGQNEVLPTALPSNARSVANRTSLLQLIWLIRHASCVVSVDSGPMHIAAAIARSLVSLHFWSDPRRVGPYRSNALIWKDGSLTRQKDYSEILRAQPGLRPDPSVIADFVKATLLD